MAKNRHILHAAARRRGNSSRAAVLIAVLAVLAGATAAVQPAQAQTTVDICERTPEVRDAILLLIAGAECTAVSQTSLDGITKLDLQGRRSGGVIIPRISGLDAGDFANLSGLESLNLNFNAPLSLPANVFDGLSTLQTLLLGVNELASVPANVFDDLSNLTMLNLGTNRLESDSLPAGLFDGLSALDDLTLDRNNLQSLDENVFGGLSNLRHLNLSHNNSLRLLPAGLFDGLSTLQELILDNNNSLTSLPVGLFNDVLDTLTLLELNTAFRTTVSMEPNTATIALNGIQTFTAQLTLPSPATVRLTITAGGVEAGNVILPDPATVTIPAGMTSADFDITLPEATVGNTGTVLLSDPVLLYTDTNGEVQENTVPAVVNDLVNVPGTIASTFAVTVAEVPPTMLTRNNPSTEEGASPTPGIFTLALSDAPDGLSTVTYTLAVSGDNADPAISAEFGGDAVGIPNTSGASDIFTMTVTDGDASATLTITPIDDDDATDEVVTLTIISIEFAGISIGPDNIQGVDSNGALAITISDDDPAATYDLEDSTASEPTSSTATDAATATFTITLSRLNQAQMDSPNRRFFFRVAPNGIGNGNLMTPGYGTPTMSIDSNNLASDTDFNLSLEYQLDDGLSVVEFTFHSDGTARETFSSNAPIPKAAGDTDEVYRFHIIPTYDGNDEGAERVLFGYRVHVSGDDSLQLTGVVDGRAAPGAATIRDDAAIRLRIRTFLEGALQ